MTAAWPLLEAARADLRAAVASADGLALEAVRAPHPVFGDLNLYQWIVFVAAHEERHAGQIREMAGAGFAPAA